MAAGKFDRVCEVRHVDVLVRGAFLEETVPVVHRVLDIAGVVRQSRDGPCADVIKLDIPLGFGVVAFVRHHDECGGYEDDDCSNLLLGINQIFVHPISSSDVVFLKTLLK